MNTINERIKQLRELMNTRGIYAYIIPTSDFHESEYVGEYFKCRKFITGFSGSAGTAVITMDEANLWTDGRYFLQAEKELSGTEIILRKSGEEGVPSIEGYLLNVLPENGRIGFDGRVVNYGLGQKFQEIAQKKNGSLHADEDLIGMIWEDRPPMPSSKAYILPNEYTGKTVDSKLSDIRQKMCEYNANIHLVSSLYDIAWILNLRGNDIDYVPVILSYMAITRDECIWFVANEALSPAVLEYLSNNKITVREYLDFYDYVAKIPAYNTILLNPNVLNFRIMSSISKQVNLVCKPDPSTLLKSIKNATELNNTIKAHTKDAIAMIKFMKWLKENVGSIPITELSASDYLEALRREQDGFIELSFETISGYNQHGAIIHYAVTPESDIELKPEGLLLVDSGAHYLEGTTDITRTFALGPITDEMRADFTRVLRSNLHLGNAKFLYGCSGLNLDILAREPLWEAFLDYKHGTGHGVGHILNVHEGPNGFRWKQSPERSENTPLEEGMITTNEPGLYIEGKYGIRTENEMICRRGIKNEYGQFMYFETITYVPIDLDAIDSSMLNETEKKWLNNYHEMVYKKMAPLLDEETATWLMKYTKAI